MLNHQAPIIVDQILDAKANTRIVGIVKVVFNETGIIRNRLMNRDGEAVSADNIAIGKDCTSRVSHAVARKGRVNSIVRLESTCHVIDIAALTIVVECNACGKLASDNREVQHELGRVAVLAFGG